MKEFATDHIRNICLVGHGGAGKTMMAEALLFTAGTINRLGRVEEGNTVSDYRSDEIERQISVSSGLLFCEWKGNKVNVLDTPGYTDFTGDVKSSLHVSDTALVLLKAVEGIEVGTELTWRYSTENRNAVILVINKLDQENADYDKVVQQAKELLSHDVIPVQFPLKAGLGFEAIVDVVRMKLVKYSPGGNGKYTEEDIPAPVQAKAQELRQQMLELIAETDESLLNKYLESGTLSPEEIKQGLKAGIRQRKLFPLLCAAATQNVGMAGVLDFVTEYAPTPQEMGPVAAKNGNGADITIPQGSRRTTCDVLSSRPCRNPTLANCRSSVSTPAASVPALT